MMSTECRLKATSIFAARALAIVGLGLMLTHAACAAKASVAERTLAGIKIFSKSGMVLKKYGTPDEVRIGDQATAPIGPGSIAQNGGGGIGPGGVPGEFGGVPPAAVPGAVPGSTAPQIATWVYDRPDGSSLEFTMSSDGRVIQIRATGFKSAVKTARGVTLGMKIGDVQARYGYPESQNKSTDGMFLNLNYSQKFHSAFQFYTSNGQNKLVGIIVAAVD